ncbi:hypothetical protein TcCL_Unassigned07285 [Trypanosoma cruzi]|nr:hypothetical protein TcCL_Unassigned07285 [Trypanosoma cruzi]
MEDKTMTELDGVESLNAVAEEEKHEIYASTKRRHSLTKDGLKALREATVEQIAESDKDVARAISLFLATTCMTRKKSLQGRQGWILSMRWVRPASAQSRPCCH